MKLVLWVTILFSSFCVHSQDTLLQQSFDEIEVSANPLKEIAFEDSKHYILDFHIGAKGKFLLLKRRSNYFLCSLSEDLQLIDSLQLNFKPKELFSDCLGFLHILGLDSMYQVEIINENLVIYESNSLSLYHDFFEGCLASNSSELIFKELEQFNQTTTYYGVSKTNQKRNNLYRIEDRILTRSAKETHDSLVRFDPGETAIMGELKGYDLDNTSYLNSIKSHKQQKDFFERIVQIPMYLPVFVRQDTTFIFDYWRDIIVVLNDTGLICRTETIPFDADSKIKLDKKQGKFYSVTRENGAQSYNLLSSENFEMIRSTKIEDHSHPRSVIIYGDYIYYLEKEFVGDNLNKLFRQRVRL